MPSLFFVSVIAVVFLHNGSDGAHIVFIHQLASYSHIVASKPLAEALVQNGHNVTYIAAVPSSAPNPNISHIVPKRLQDFIKAVINEDFDISTRIEGKMPSLLTVVDMLNLEACRALLGSNEFQTWMNSTSKVDLIYVDTFPECGTGIAYKLKSKLAIFTPLAMSPRYFDTLGLPTESSSIPTWSTVQKTPLSFLDRVKNTLIPLGWRLSQVLYWGAMESVIKEHLDIPVLPTRDELFQTVSLVLMNGHFMDEHRRSFPPMFVSVPGLHVQKTHQPLTQDVQAFVDSNGEDGTPSEGFVYISFGTVVKAPNLPQKIREIFFNAMKAFPNIRFLWRWDGEFPKDKPTNLYLSKWFKQQDLLGNSKIRGFVTQSGRPSSQEGLYNGVPTIAFPILADQDYNADVLEGLGVGVNLEIGDIDEEKLKKAFSKILFDQTMKDRSLEVSKLYKDLPMEPIDTAVWWTEYLLRNKDFSHLKPLAINQTWYQRRLLDVWAFLTIIVILFGYFIFLISRLLFKFVLRNFLSSNKVKVE